MILRKTRDLYQGICVLMKIQLYIFLKSLCVDSNTRCENPTGTYSKVKTQGSITREMFMRCIVHIWKTPSLQKNIYVNNTSHCENNLRLSWRVLTESTAVILSHVNDHLVNIIVKCHLYVDLAILGSNKQCQESNSTTTF